MIVEEIVCTFSLCDALAEKTDQQAADQRYSDCDGKTNQLEAALTPSASAGEHLDVVVGVVRAIWRGREEDSRVNGANERRNEENEDGAKRVKDSFSITGFDFTVEASRKPSPAETDQQGWERVREDV